MSGGMNGLGAWAPPKLDAPVRFVGLTKHQWCYLATSYALWDKGHALLPVALWWPWAGFCVLLALAGILIRWHGLHLYRVAGVMLDYRITPRLAVWRPLEPAWTALEAPEEDDDEDDAGLDEAPATDANPLGWDAHRLPLAGVGTAA